MTVFVSSAYLFCHDKVSSVATDLSLALSHFVLQGLSFYPFYVATVLCVFTGTVKLRH